MVHQRINELAFHDEVNGIYLLRFAKMQHAKNGNDYLLGMLADRSGEISCVVWNYNGSLDSEIGAPILVTGRVQEYQGKKQIAVRSAEAAPEDEVILSEILPTSEVDPQILYHQVRSAIATIEDVDFRHLCETIYDKNKERLLTAPASIGSHHAYLGGYLTHVSAMVSGAVFLSAKYPSVNRSLLLTAVLMHDIGKLLCYKYSRYGYAIGCTNEGTLLGHASLGSKMVSDAAVQLGVSDEKMLLLQNTIIHHHNNGDPTRTHCREGKLLQMLDCMDCCASSASDFAA